MQTVQIAVDAAEYDLPNHGNPYRALWAGVLNQAMSDCRTGPDKVYGDCKTRGEYSFKSLQNAFHFEVYWREWLGSEDLYRVCDFAEIDSARVLALLNEEYKASYHRYINGIEMRYTKILRERTAARKAQEARIKEIVEKHTKGENNA